MSVLNLAFHDAAVWFLSDTMVYDGQGRPAGLSERKAHVATSGRWIHGTRGAVVLGDAVDSLLADAETFDDAARCARGFLAALPEDLLALYDRDPVEVTLAGWSDMAGDLSVLRLNVRREWSGGYAVCETVCQRGVTLLPGSSASGQLPRTVTERQFVRLALAQWKIQDRLPERQCLGGIMHLTAVDRHGASQRIVELYGDYHQHAAELGDPNAEAVARFLAEREAIAA